jgi:L-fuculose-phosphate aldolase
MRYKSDEELRPEITKVCRLMHEKGLLAGYDGNISHRLGMNRFLITPSGINKAFIEASDLVVIDGTGRLLRGKRQPSSEYRMHLTIYEERPDINCVVHAHPPHCIACTLADISLETLVLPETAYLIGAVPTIGYQTPGTDSFAEAVKPHLKNRSSLLLERHGSVTMGEDLWMAYNRLESLEHVASVLFITRGLGQLRPLADHQVQALREQVTSRGLPWQYADGSSDDMPQELIEGLASRVMAALEGRTK